MATSTYKGYILQANGSNAGTWGDKLNDEMISYVDLNLGGTKNQSLSNTNVTLSAADSRNVIYRLTGVLSANVTVYVDASVASGFFIVENLTTGSYTVTVANTTPATATVNITQGTRSLLISDNTNGVRIASSYGIDPVTTFSAGTTGLTPSTATNGAVTLAGTLSVANGGTGLGTLTANNVILGNGTSTPQFVAPGTSGNFLTSNGTTWVSATYVPLNYGTLTATTSGSEINFSNVIPSTAKRIQVIFGNVSSSSSGDILIQLGYGGTPTYQTTGYLSTCWRTSGTVDTSTEGFIVTTTTNSAYIFSGFVTLLRLSPSSDYWVEYGNLQDRDGPTIGSVSYIPQISMGNVTLSGSISSLRLKLTTGTFDAGSVNITWES